MRIKYLSFGKFKTGGYRHETILYDSLVKYLSKNHSVKAEKLRLHRYFENPIAYLKLLWWAFKNADADINVVTSRLAIPAMIKNSRNNKQVWIVLHNYDPNDGKSEWMKLYYKWLFKRLKNTNHSRFKIITVSPFWKQYFKEEIGITNTYIFPNLFDVKYYRKLATQEKNPWIHLGQLSSKNDPEIYKLAEELVKDGYYCYFSTLDANEVRQNGNFGIIKFDTFKDYLEQMAKCCCTLALTEVNEGWNRLAHESILVGTPVIGYDKGGLGDLLRESNSLVVRNIEEAYTCIREALWVLPDESFYEHYSLTASDHFIEQICNQ